MSDVPLQIAETIQTAHIKRRPSPQHDLNPSSAASAREPVVLDDGTDDEGDDDVPYSVVRPKPRHGHFPPLPDLRFEQSYLHSIANADRWWKVAWVTVRDQVMMPFAQGVVYNIGICGWQYWNRNAQLRGNTMGARLRRWWYDVNNWPVPGKRKRL